MRRIDLPARRRRLPYTEFLVNVTLDSRLKLGPEARFRRVGDEGVVVQQAAAEVMVINDTAARLVELSDGTRTIADCASVIESDFDVEHDAVTRDLLRFAEELIAAGVAKIV